MVEPVRAQKWDAETAAKMTGYSARSNVHGRDALRLVYGRGRPRPLLSTVGGYTRNAGTRF